MGLLLDPEGRLRPGWRLLLYLLAFSIAGAMASVLGSVLSRTGAVPRWAVGALVGLTGGGLCVLLFWLLRRAVDRRPWSWLGLVPSSPTFALLGWGLVSGVAMLGALFAVETVLGWIEPSTVLTTATLSAAAGALFASMGIGVLEELLLRGAVLQNLGERFPLWAATLATGVLFGLLHLANPAQRVGVGVVVSAVVATLMLTLSRFVTGSLAWAIGWHAGWDWAQDLLGIAEPGASRPAQWVSVVQRGPAFWTGVAPSIEEGHWPSFSSPSVRPLFGRLPGEGGQSTGSGRFSTGNRDGLWSPVRGRGDRRFFVRP
jgi:hypothetical protein